MPYARLDDRYDDHRKIKRALRREPAAVALHAMAITMCNRHNTNGEVDIDWIEEKLALMPYKPKQRAAVLAVLVDLNLFERVDDETYEVHDFLDWNLSSEQRARLAEQGRRGGKAKGEPSPPPSHGLSEGLSHGLIEGSSQSENDGLSTPTPRHATPRQTSPKPPGGVAEVFAYWQQTCGHPTAKLTSTRRRKIETRLRDGYTVEQLHQAIDGAARGAFVNDAGKRFDDIELICRTGEKVEDFMGRAKLRAINGGARKTDGATSYVEALNARNRERPVEGPNGPDAPNPSPRASNGSTAAPVRSQGHSNVARGPLTAA